MAVNKVEYGNQTLIDLTTDTVTESDVLEGVTFHNADGTVGTGNVKVPTNAKDITYDNDVYTNVDSMLTHLSTESVNHGSSIINLNSDIKNVRTETLASGVLLTYGSNGIGQIEFTNASALNISNIALNNIDINDAVVNVSVVSGSNRYLGQISLATKKFYVYKMVQYGASWSQITSTSEYIFGTMPVVVHRL